MRYDLRNITRALFRRKRWFDGWIWTAVVALTRGVFGGGIEYERVLGLVIGFEH